MARQEGVVIVTIHEAMQELSSFVERNRPFFPKLNLTTPRPLDAKIFPDEWSQVRPPQNGMYVIFRSESQEIVYVGIAASVERRIYEHIGPGFSWARSGSQCNFPSMALAAQRPWLAAQTQDLLRRGDFRVQVHSRDSARVLCTAGGVPHCSRLRKGGTATRGQRGLLTRNLIGQHEALDYQRDGHRVGVDALARDAAGGVGGAEEG
jgi:hypothetical protein